MNQFNPMQLLSMIRQGSNPQQLIMNMLQKSMPNTPISNNLINMMQKNDGAGIEKIARNICASQGKDFDKEFNAFKQNFGL